MAAEEFGYSEDEQPAWSAGMASPAPAAPITGEGGAAFGVYPPARSRRPALRVNPLELNNQGLPPSVVRRQPEVQTPPAEMRAYEPTMRESLAARTQTALQGAGVDKARARRISQTLVGGPQSNLPLGIGAVDIPLLPSVPLLMQEGYRGTERSMQAAERGDYGAAAMEYLGAAAAMAPGAAVTARAVPPVARALNESMGARAVTGAMARSQRGTFLPEQRFTPREKAKIATAQDLESKGSDPREVWKQTGLVRDFDGSWMVEISDDKMRFKGLEAIERAREPIVKRIDDLVLARALRTRMDNGVTLDEAKAALKTDRRTEPSANVVRMAQDRSVEQIDMMLENANSSLLAPIRGLKYKDVIEHPELLARVPELADMQVDFLNGPAFEKGSAGYFDPSGPGMGTIAIDRRYLNPSENYGGRSLAVHEGQHALDYSTGKEYGISPSEITEAESWFKNELASRMDDWFDSVNALQVRRLMDKNPGMSADEAFDKLLNEGNHFGTSARYAKAGVTPSPETGEPIAAEGSLRKSVLDAATDTKAADLEKKITRAREFVDAAYNMQIRSPLSAWDRYLTERGEVRARLPQTRLDLTPEQRASIFPMEQGPGAMDVSPADVRTVYELTGGRKGPMPRPTGFSSSTRMGRQRGAVMFSMGGEQGRPLRDVLAEQPTTLRVLEALPGKRTTLTVDEIQQQMRRPEVTKQEKDVLERVLANAQGGTISAEDLVKRVQAETGNFRLEPVDTEEYAEYGLENIGRDTNERPWVGAGITAFNVRTTAYRSPMETGASSHFHNEPNYFAHSRAFEDKQGVPHVVEIQSDLVQKAAKELSPEERARLEEAVTSLQGQKRIYDDVIGSMEPELAYAPSSRRAPILLGRLVDRQAEIGALNPDAIMLLEDEIVRRLSEESVNSIPTGLAPGDLLRGIADGSITLQRDTDYTRAFDALSRRMRDLDVLAAEHRAKLDEQVTNRELQPMFKNWERRVIREELAREAAAHANLQNRIAYLERVGAKLPGRDDSVARALAAEIQQVKERLGRPPVVRFADADTVAEVESWPRKQIINPGTAFDSSFQGGMLVGKGTGNADRLVYTGNVRVDDSGNVTAEAIPLDVTGQRIGEATWVASTPTSLSMAVREQFFKKSKELEFPEHQSIYDRYNKEIANYLKSLDAKRVVDEFGNGWWEVPVKPQQRRTQIFSMGGGMAGAAAYNATTPAMEEQ
jgi:hypothetical protein